VDYDDVLSNYDYSYDYYNNYYGSIPSQCGLSYEDSGYFESIHPYLARTRKGQISVENGHDL